MAKPKIQSSTNKAVGVIFFILVSLSLLSPLWVFRDLLFPFITSKAFTFRGFIELAFPCYVYLAVADKSLRPNWKNPLLLSMLAFLGLSFVSSFTGVNVIRSLWGNFERMGGAYYLLHLELLALYLVMMAQISGLWVKRLLYVAFGVALVIMLNGLSGWLGGPTLVTDPSLPTRVSSTLGNPIFLGSYLILPLFLAAFFALQEEDRFKQISFWVLAILSLIGIFLSVTRGATVGLGAGIVLGAAVFVFLTNSRKVRQIGIPVVVLGTALIVSLFVFHSKLPQDRVTRMFNLNDSNTQARLIQWGTALRGFKDYPMLGVGPENYYILANKYYNPEIIKYDPSWFDKPHNYVLEVLVTTGILGFAAYMAMTLLVFWAAYRAFKAGLISLLQLALLVAGFAAYFVQNLTVFDTIPASMMFYLFVGFAIYLWDQSEEQPMQQLAYSASQSKGFAAAAAGVSAVVAVYALCVTNIVPAGAAKAVNYGYAYSSVDANTSINYFKQAVNSSFNFDPQDTGQRYSDSIDTIAQSGKLDSATLQKAVDDVTNYEKQVAQSIGNDPVSWQKLSSDYYLQNLVNKQPLSPEIEQADLKAIALAPTRFEPNLFLGQVYIAENRLADAQAQLQKLADMMPLTAYSSSATWLKASVEQQQGNNELALADASRLKEQDFQAPSYQTFSWILDYYNNKKDYPNMLDWAELGLKWFPNQAESYYYLAVAQSQTGDIADAKANLQKLIDANAGNKDQAQKLLDSLPK